MSYVDSAASTTSTFGRDVYGEPSRETRPVQGSLYRGAATAQVVDYGVAEISWTLPTAEWTRIRLIRSSLGPPVNGYDGTLVYEARSDRSVSTVIDSVTGWMTWSVFVLVGDDWYFSSSATAFVPQNQGINDLLYSWLPSYVRSSDATGDLRDFVDVLGLETAIWHGMTKSMEHARNPEKLPTVLVNDVADSLGIPNYADALGRQRLRALLRTVPSARNTKGTISALTSVVSSLTGSRVSTSTTSNRMANAAHTSFGAGTAACGWRSPQAAVTVESVGGHPGLFGDDVLRVVMGSNDGDDIDLYLNRAPVSSSAPSGNHLSMRMRGAPTGRQPARWTLSGYVRAPNSDAATVEMRVVLWSADEEYNNTPGQTVSPSSPQASATVYAAGPAGETVYGEPFGGEGSVDPGDADAEFINATPTSTEWRRFWATVDVPASVVVVSPQVFINGGTAFTGGEEFLFEGFQAERANEPTSYSDPRLTNVFVSPARRNLVRNPTFTVDEGLWDFNGVSAQSVGGGQAELTINNSEVPADAVHTLSVRLVGAATFSADVGVAGGDVEVSLQFDWFDEQLGSLGSLVSSLGEVVDGYTRRVAGTVYPPVGSVVANMTILFSGEAGVVVTLSRILLEDTGQLFEYFDGSMGGNFSWASFEDAGESYHTPNRQAVLTAISSMSSAWLPGGLGNVVEIGDDPVISATTDFLILNAAGDILTTESGEPIDYDS